ncbi:SGNH/GDSL hydrolase family protein [Tundrisphaera sp. TA3]|uniref:SGNH/GDSL hydrolase family protein n=1 Tax=Tundrisphaera sp. TA3 TaxID=3435775 RepID=UPI003EB8D276
MPQPRRHATPRTLILTLFTLMAPIRSEAGEHLGGYPLDESHLSSPFWRSRTQFGESVLFLKEPDRATADGTLLLRPATVRRVRNAQTGEVYEAGRDYTIDAPGRRLVATEGSRIPRLDRSELTKPPRSPGSIPHKLGDPGTWIRYQENGFHALQVEVDYDADEAWPGIRPAHPDAALARAIAKLKAKGEFNLVVTGDSISTGANASRKELPPHQPAYPELLAAGLEAKYGARVQLTNVSVGGATVAGAMSSIDAVVAARPDLVIVAYGMNDVASHDTAKYEDGVRRVIEAVRARAPETDFILVATSRGNPDWVHTPADQFPRFLEALSRLRGDHIALLDLTTLYGEILARKRFIDLTGNGVNHPNDWGHRFHAQAFLDLLTDDGATP